MKGFIYCTGIKFANETQWDRVWNIFVGTDLHTEQELLLNGLGCTREAILIERLTKMINFSTKSITFFYHYSRYLNLSIAPDSPIRKQYRITGVNSLLADDHLDKLLHILEFFDNHLKQTISWLVLSIPYLIFAITVTQYPITGRVKFSSVKSYHRLDKKSKRISNWPGYVFFWIIVVLH